MPNFDWIELLVGKREADQAPSIRLDDAQVCFEIGEQLCGALARQQCSIRSARN